MKLKIMKKISVKTIIAGVVFLTLLAGMMTNGFGFYEPAGQEKSVKEPAAQPELDNRMADLNMSLVNSQGEQVRLSDFNGKVIFMNFWATWCPPCRTEMPSINSLYNKMKDENVVFIMLSMDRDFEKAIAYNEEEGFDFDVYAPTGDIPEMYYSQGIPTTFVISAKGELALKHVGMADYDQPEFVDFLTGLQ